MDHRSSQAQAPLMAQRHLSCLVARIQPKTQTNLHTGPVPTRTGLFSPMHKGFTRPPVSFRHHSIPSGQVIRILTIPSVRGGRGLSHEVSLATCSLQHSLDSKGPCVPPRQRDKPRSSHRWPEICRLLLSPSGPLPQRSRRH